MNILGISLGYTYFGKSLKDGGACFLANDSQFVGVSEERVSGKKYAGGYEKSVEYLIQHKVMQWENIDIIGYSSCCEPEGAQASIEAQLKVESLHVNHHLSHAYLAYETSGFDDALVVVVDSGGNLLQSTKTDKWWEAEREQHSYFSFTENKAELIGRDFSKPFAVGLGEFWRSVTYGCGFSSSVHASKVMELAAMGDPLELPSPFEMSGRELVSDLRYVPKEPLAILREWIGRGGSEFPPRRQGDKIRLAAWAQAALEEAILQKLRVLKAFTGHRNLCLGGGVFLNCKLVNRIEKEAIFEKVHVSFAPSDKGQCVGNAIYLRKTLVGPRVRNSRNPFIGVKHRVTAKQIRDSLAEFGSALFVKGLSYNTIGHIVNSGGVIGVFYDKAEFGARALGNRSIIASAFMAENKERINRIKGRALFNPIAPSVLQNTVSRYFCAEMNSPYMERVCFSACDSEMQNRIASGFHEDGSSRLQTVSDEFPESFLSRFLKEIDGSVVLNTSFNGKGHPIVETPANALREFWDLNLDGVLINDFFVWRSSAQVDSIIAKEHETQWEMFVLVENPADIEELRSNAELLLDGIGEIKWREKFSLYDNYINWLETGRKITTIRFLSDGLTLPTANTLPLIRTPDFKQMVVDLEGLAVRVRGVGIKKFKNLNLTDAKRDGFKRTSDLKRILKSIYPAINSESFVSVNFIELIR